MKKGVLLQKVWRNTPFVSHDCIAFLALRWQWFSNETGWIGGFVTTEQGSQSVGRYQRNALLATIGLLTLGLQVRMVVESLIARPAVKSVLEAVGRKEPASQRPLPQPGFLRGYLYGGNPDCRT